MFEFSGSHLQIYPKFVIKDYRIKFELERNAIETSLHTYVAWIWSWICRYSQNLEWLKFQYNSQVCINITLEEGGKLAFYLTWDAKVIFHGSIINFDEPICARVPLPGIGELIYLCVVFKDVEQVWYSHNFNLFVHSFHFRCNSMSNIGAWLDNRWVLNCFCIFCSAGIDKIGFDIVNQILCSC